MEITICRVGPELAQQWLASMATNRHLSSDRVAMFARDMVHGQWRLSIDAIAFNALGRLVNGQHRLRAIIASGVTVPMAVAHNIDDQAIKTIDAVRARQLNDQLSIEGGHKNVCLLAATVRWVHAYETGWGKLSAGGHATAVSCSNTEGLALLHRYPTLSDSLPIGKRVAHLRIPSSVACFVHFMASRYDAERAEEFFSALVDGAGLSPGNPVLALRERMFNFMVASKATRLQPGYVCALMIKAWNAFVRGQPIYKLGFRTTRESKESFPVFVGLEPGSGVGGDREAHGDARRADVGVV